jgi:hypothetical protein
MEQVAVCRNQNVCSTPNVLFVSITYIFYLSICETEWNNTEKRLGMVEGTENKDLEIRKLCMKKPWFDAVEHQSRARNAGCGNK